MPLWAPSSRMSPKVHVCRLLSFLQCCFQELTCLVIWSLSGFVIISITILSCASPNYHTGEFVFSQFINQTGCTCYPMSFEH